MRFVVIVLLLVGMAVNVVAWKSVEPLAIGLVFYSVGLGLTCFLPAPRDNLRFFSTTYVIYWATTGVSSLYLNFGYDISQRFGDAQNFFLFATGAEGTLPLNEIYDVSEGAIAIKIWYYAYEASDAIGFTIEPYIGTTVNSMILALVSVLSLQILRRISSKNPNSERVLLLLFALCPMFWLAASIHLRDAFVILLMALNYYVLIQFITRKPNLFWFGAAFVVTAVFPVILRLLRTELAVIPTMLAAAAIIATIVFRDNKKGVGNLKYVILLLISLLIVLLIDNLNLIGMESITKGRDNYSAKAINTGIENSLGYNFVVDQPLYIRLILGIPYLLLMPIPLWAGFSMGTAYMLYKTLFAVFNYFFIPYLAVAIGGSLHLSGKHRVPIYFLLGSSVTLMIAVAVTSLESRHLIPFLPPLFIAAAAMVGYVMVHAKRLRLFMRILLLMIVGVHFAWFLLKS